MPDNENDSQGPLTASVARLRKELDYWLEAALTQGGKALDKFGLGGTGRGWCPAVDVIESAETVDVYLDIPGVESESVDLTLTGNMLTITAEKRVVETGENQTVHVRERGSGKTSRSIPMPVAVDPDNVSADIANGTLHVRLTKSERTIPRQIEVTAASASPAATST